MTARSTTWRSTPPRGEVPDVPAGKVRVKVFRLEMVTVPVSDVDRAKAFYVEQLGFTVEQDVLVDLAHRFVELVPSGSGCTIALTMGYIDSQPGSLRGMQFNVDDVFDAHAFLVSRGVPVSEVQEYPWGRFCFFSDPDRNEWSVHEAPGQPGT
jgi:catechol 2,3-dioxygenase-like lactoylglutathione lyase family enzyme